MEKKLTQAVFVYGTLMRGERAEHLMAEGEFAGEYTLSGYALYDLGRNPGILAKAGEEVDGEVNSLGLTVSWERNDAISAWVATITPDAFPPALRAASDIQVRVRMLNVNLGKSASLLETCKPLAEYAWIVDAIRKNERALKGKVDDGILLETAIDRAVDAIPGDFIIKQYLETHRAEVKGMLLTEYNEAQAMELFRLDGMREGRREGMREGMREGERKGRLDALLDGARSLTRNLGMDPREALEALRQRGILVRWFDKEGIRDWLRITVGAREEMEALVRAVRGIIEGEER